MSIRNRLALSLLLCTLHSALATAQSITIPNTFVNGTAADATQVNANFSSLANNALNRTGGTMTGTLTTLLVQPTLDNTSDLGTSSLMYRSLYAKTSLVFGAAAGNYTLTWANPAAARAISFEDPGGTDILVYKAATQTLTNKIISGTSTFNAGAVTSNGAITGVTGAFSRTTDGNVVDVANTNGTFTNTALTVHVTRAASTAYTMLDLQANAVSQFKVNGAGIVTAAGAGTHSFSAANAGQQTLELKNTSDGSDGGYAAINVQGGTVAAGLFTFGQSYSTSTWLRASALALRNGALGGVNLVADDAAGIIRFYTGGTTLRGQIDASGNHALGGTNITDAISAPTISSGFGTGPSIAGKASFFTVTTGTGGPVSGVVAFNTTFNSTPACVATTENISLASVQVVPSTTQVTISFSAAYSSSKVHVLCRGF